MKRQLRVITNSELRTYRRCQREHHFAYNLGIRPTADAEALHFGRLWHLAQEELWGGFGLEAAIYAATSHASDEYEGAKLRVLLTGYVARWGGPPGDVVAVEKEFRAPMVNPTTGAASRTFQLGGKLDVLRKAWFVEHKTTSEEIGPGSLYWRRLVLDSQVSTYYAGARALGVEVEGCVYDVVRKPSLRPSQVAVVDSDGVKVVRDATGDRVRTKDGKKWRQTGDAELGYALQTRPETPGEYEARLTEDVAANPDRYYQRGEVVRLEAEERDYAIEVWQLTRAMRESVLSDSHPRNADACQRYGRLCGYFDVCCGTASIEDTSRFEHVDNVHQELSIEAAE